MSAWAVHPARTGMKASAAGYGRRQSGCHAPASEIPQALRQKESDPGIVTGRKSRF